MQLSQIKPSLTELNRKDALALIINVRKSRRTRKIKPAQKKASIKKVQTKSKKVIKQTKEMNAEQLAQLITYLEEKKKNA